VDHDPANLDTTGGQPVLRLERRFAHSPDTVWKAITEPAELAHWFPARVDTALEVGAAMRFTFEGEDESTEGEILEFDPPKVFMFRWNDDVLRMEILPEDTGCRLVFSHTLSEAYGGRPAAGRNAAGWDTCLAGLMARLDGRPARQPAEPIFELMGSYIQRFGLAEGKFRDHPDGHLLRFELDLVWRPAEEVWAALTEADGAEPVLAAVGSAPPPRFTNGYVAAGPATQVSPPNLLEYDWQHDGTPAGRVRWEVVADPKAGTRVVLTQTVPAPLAGLRATALAAWQTHLELFFAALFGSPRRWPAERTEALTELYASRLG
jgi:uncharacterized protein YndB with AHSA1/START domain